MTFQKLVKSVNFLTIKINRQRKNTNVKDAGDKYRHLKNSLKLKSVKLAVG